MVMGTAMEKSWWRLEDEPKELADGLEMGGGGRGKRDINSETTLLC